MTARRPLSFLATAAVIPLIAVTAATAAPAPSAHATAHTATVRVAHTGLGRILVDSTGRTLYLFKRDVGDKSACSGQCATAWPPLLVKGKPTAGTGLTASKLGTIKRSGGQRQVTYNRHPVYLYIGDMKPGNTNGQGVTAFGASWFALSPSGNQIATRSNAAAPSGGGGY
jgi:predicted lipoprotein with Yx(FWY)xxD motif